MLWSNDAWLSNLFPPGHFHTDVLRLVEPSLEAVPSACSFDVEFPKELGDDLGDFASRDLSASLAIEVRYAVAILTNMLPNTSSLTDAKGAYIVPHPRCLVLVHQPPLWAKGFRILTKNPFIPLWNATAGTQISATRPPAPAGFGAPFGHNSRKRVADHRVDAEAFVDNCAQVRERSCFYVGNLG